MTGGLVPGTREIKGAVLDRLPYHLVWWPPTVLLISLHSSLLDPLSHTFCSCRLDRGELVSFGAVLVTLPVALCHRQPLPYAYLAATRCYEVTGSPNTFCMSRKWFVFACLSPKTSSRDA